MATPAPTTLYINNILFILHSHQRELSFQCKHSNTAAWKGSLFSCWIEPSRSKKTHMETCMFSAILNTCFSCEISCGRPSLSSFYPYITVQFDTVNSNPWQCFLSNPVRHSWARIEKKVKFESFAQAFQYANVVNSTVA